MERLHRIAPGLAATLMVATIICGLMTPCSHAQSTDPIVIGAVLSLTGRDAAFGQECLAGLDIAMDEANAEGGIHNRPVTLQVYDDKSDPVLAAEGVRTLVRQFNPVAIVGSNTSMVTSAAAVAAQAVGVPLIVPEATKPEISSIGDWIYRVCFIDPDMAAGLATYAYGDLGLRRVAILTEEKHDYTLSFTKYFRDKFVELGGEIVYQAGYKAGATEFDPMVKEAGTAQADAIMVSGFYSEAGYVIACAKRLNANLAFLGGDGWESNGLFTAAGDAITDRSRVFIASHFSADVKRVKVRGFVDVFQEKFGRRPNTSSALGFDAGGLIVAAITDAATATGAGLKAAMQHVHHEGVTGHITIDETRNPSKKIIIMQAGTDRRFAYVRAISPETLQAVDATQ
jgi:branched-chain amino acid transport system substrate-binding protein